jgi:hypothetical protein
MDAFEKVFDTAFTHGNIEHVTEDLRKTIVGKMMGSVEVGYQRGDGLTKLDSSCEMLRVLSTCFPSTGAGELMTTVFRRSVTNGRDINFLSTGEDSRGLNE